MNSTASGKPSIVLFNPSPWVDTHYYGLPLALLSIAALPHAAGYPVKIVVQDVDDDPEREVLEACENALLFGVTSLTGVMIGNGLDMCAKVRARYPNLPIVWGGTHPSIAPEQTCAHPLVDIVVVGQGEATFMELVEALEQGRPLDSVAGLRVKQDGQIVSTGCRKTIDINTLPPTPFELLDVERFISLHSGQLQKRLAGRRSVTYYTSYGCPFSCSFCSEPTTSNRRWFAKTPQRVIEEIELLNRRYGADVIIFEDPIYFVDVRRVRKIAEMIIERGLDILWAGTSRLEAIKKIDAETWDILTRSGFTQVFIGIESASPTVLKGIGKHYTADDIVEASRILYEHDVQLVCTYIQGVPVEAPGRTLDDILREDIRMTSQTILRMHEVNPKASIGVVMYTPYPGSVAYDLSIKYGFAPPTTLDGWRDFSHYSNQVPWMLPEQEVFSRMALISQMALKGRIGGRRRVSARRAIVSAYAAITRKRYEHGYFKYPYEQRAIEMLARRVTRKKSVQKNKEGFLI